MKGNCNSIALKSDQLDQKIETQMIMMKNIWKSYLIQMSSYLYH